MGLTPSPPLQETGNFADTGTDVMGLGGVWLGETDHPQVSSWQGLGVKSFSWAMALDYEPNYPAASSSLYLVDMI